MNLSLSDSRNNYVTNPIHSSGFLQCFPNLYFYPRMLSTVFKASYKAKRGRYSEEDWIKNCADIIRFLEKVDCRITIQGKKNFINLKEPCVFVGNHMSPLETFVLGAIIGPHRPMTFVVKESLMRYPVFKHILMTINPIVVSRKNSREDFKVVMEEGKNRLDHGTSVVVFPQGERAKSLEPEKFNSMGVKLAKRAKIPAVPLALKTDAWDQGWIIKDFGRIRPFRPIYFSFGRPMHIQGNGRNEHEKILDFISSRLNFWQKYHKWFGMD